VLFQECFDEMARAYDLNSSIAGYPLQRPIATYNKLSPTRQGASQELVICMVGAHRRGKFWCLNKEPLNRQQIKKVPRSTPENCCADRWPTTRYSSKIATDITISTRPSRHPSNTRYGQPPKKRPDISTLVSTTILNLYPAPASPPASHQTSSYQRAWRRPVPPLQDRRTPSSMAL
jgi:hypothetical protein